MAVKIGPRIEVEGEPQYRQQMNNIIQQTKTLASEMKALSSSFDNQNKSLKQNKQQRELLNEQIKKQEEALKKQTEMLEKSSQKYGENDNSTLKYRENVAETTAELNRLKSQLDKLPTSIELVAQKMSSAGEKMKTIGSDLSKVGSTLTRNVTTPIVGAFTLGVKSAIDWESAFTGVMKTVDETTTTTYEDIAKGIKEIAKTTASSKEEIAQIAEVAGQLGISADDVTEFTRTMIMLGDTTNLTAEEAATAIARIVNITGDSSGSVDKLGSVIVALGNNFATTESEIVNMANRLAASGKLAGLTTPEIFGLSAAMSSVGIQAEAGGTAMTQTLTSLEKNVANFKVGAESNLEKIAEIAGMSATEFADAWESKPAEAITSFIKGLGNLDEKGESATLVLDELEMSGIRQANMLKSLALASDTLGGAMGLANDAYGENLALTNEANKRYETMSAKINQMKERLSEVAIQVGEILMPHIESFVNKIGEIADKFSALDEPTQKLIVTITGVVAVIGPAVLIVGKIITSIGTVVSAIGGLVSFVTGVLIPAITAVVSTIGAPVLAAVAAVIAIGVLLWKNWDTVKEKATQLGEWLKRTWDNIKTWIGNAWESIKQTTTTVWNNIKASVVSIGQSMSQSVSNLVNGIKTTFVNTFNNIWNFVSGIVGKLKSIFNFTWSLPHIKLPHFKISGSFSLMPPSVPHISIDWYKKAMQGGTILNGATIFGEKNGKLLGGGEAGPEVVVGASSLYGMIQQAVGSTGGGETDIVINVYGAEGQNVNELAREIEKRLTNMYESRRMVFGQ